MKWFPMRNASLWTCLLAAPCLLVVTAFAREPGIRMVRNINKTPGGFSRSIHWIQPAGEKVLFNAYSSKEGDELWVSDGTLWGTKLLKDIRPGEGGSLNMSALAMDGFVYFGADDGVHGFELWRSDGTAEGTQMVADLRPGPDHGPGWVHFADHGVVYSSDASLWASKGTAQGSVELNSPDAVTGERRFENPRSFVALGESTYFLADENAVWKSDGSIGGTIKVGEVGTADDSYASEMKVMGNRLLITGGSDGTIGGVVWVMAPPSGVQATLTAPQGELPWDQIQDICVSGDQFFFSPFRYDDGNGNFETTFWVSDGTGSGTRQLLPNDGYSPVSWQGRVYFVVSSADSDSRLWQSDGTEAGTVPVEAFGEGAYYVWRAGDQLYFVTINPNDLWQLWRTDGTQRGTVKLQQIRGADFPGAMLPLGEDLYFTASTGTYDSTLFRASGRHTAVARLTRNEKSDLSALDLAAPMTAVSKSGRLYFTATSHGEAQDIWKSDGTFAGTRKIYGEQNYVRLLGAFGDHVLFVRTQPQDGWQLCSISGKKDRTQVLGDWEGWDTSNFTDAGKHGFFIVPKFDKPELWRSDGTPEGSFQVIAANGAAASPEDGSLVALNGVVYFIEKGRKPAAALWRSDGTSAGTYPVREFLPQDIFHDVFELRALTRVGNRLAFFRSLIGHGCELWTSDGTTQGTVSICTTPNWLGPEGRVASWDLNGQQLFFLRDFEGSCQWWRSDGSPAGTYVIDNSSEAGLGQIRLDQSVVAGGKLFFLRESPAGLELWKTGASSGSLSRIKDLLVTTSLVEHDGRVYFSATDSANGWRSWVSDGTETGTMIVDNPEKNPRYGGAFPLLSTGGRMFYKGFDRKAGVELHVLVPGKR